MICLFKLSSSRPISTAGNALSDRHPRKHPTESACNGAGDGKALFTFSASPARSRVLLRTTGDQNLVFSRGSFSPIRGHADTVVLFGGGSAVFLPMRF
jgi:hypothetical protein